MDKPDAIIAALVEEDRLLRQLLDQCPQELKEVRGSGGTLSVKETLGHLAFWDTFAVSYFLAKLDTSNESLAPPADFETRSRQELQRMRGLSYDEVLHRYERATRGLLGFLRTHWHELSAKQQTDFTVPLKHRRHHRLLLARSLGKSSPTSEGYEQAEQA